MTLATNRDTTEMKLFAAISALSLPMAASTEIFAGALVMYDAAGNAVNGNDDTALTAAGRAEKHVDNGSGLAGALSIDVKPGIFRFANGGSSIAASDRGSVCYVEDEETVYLTDNSDRPVAGVIVDVDSQGVWVAIGFQFFSAPAATPSGSLQKKTLTLDATITGSADTNGTACSPQNIGTALPAGAVLVATALTLATPASGGSVSEAKVDSGWAGSTEAIVKDVDSLGCSSLYGCPKSIDVRGTIALASSSARTYVRA